jgi:hypothetical protein
MTIMYAMIALVVANLVIGVLCRLAAPRGWGRHLCLAAMVITALPVLWIVKVIAENAHLKESTVGIYALPGLLLLVEWVWLLVVYLGAYVRQSTPRPK